MTRRLVTSALFIAALVLSINQSASAVSYADAVASDNPTYYYRFEGTDTAGGVVNQGSTGAAFNATYGAGFTNGDLGKASAFTGNAIEFTGPNANAGTNKFVSFGSAIPELVNFRPPSVNKATTVEYWINTTQTGSNNNTWQTPSLLAHESPGDGDLYWGNIDSAGNFRMSTSDIVEISAGGVTNGNWHHIMMVKTWNTANPNTSIMYIDGGTLMGGQTLIAQTPAGNASYQDTDSGVDRLGVTIGGELDNVQYIGQFDELAIYNRGLSAAAAAKHYAAATGQVLSDKTYSQAVTASTPIAYWRFEEDAGSTTAFDSVGSTNGTYVNIGLGTANDFNGGQNSLGRAARFTTPNGANGGGGGSSIDFGTAGFGALQQLTNVDSGGDPNFSNTKKTSLEFWLKTDQVSNDGANWRSPLIFGRESPGDGDIQWGFLTTGGQIGINANDNGGGSQVTPVSVSDNEWHYIVMNYDWQTATNQVFLDGSLLATVVGGGNIFQDADALVRYMGWNDTTDQPASYLGFLDEVAIYNRLLSLQEVQGHYLASLTQPGVPEPATFTLLGVMGAALVGRRRRREA